MTQQFDFFYMASAARDNMLMFADDSLGMKSPKALTNIVGKSAMSSITTDAWNVCSTRPQYCKYNYLPPTDMEVDKPL